MKKQSKPKAIICDMDGTLAIRSERGIFEFENSWKDSLNLPVFQIVQMFSCNYEIVILTGRQNKFREVTLRWLNDKKIPYNQLVMRETGDGRSHSLVKKELYKEFVEPYHDVLFVLDDAQEDVDMWRKEVFLTCFQPNYGV
jgi:beta-phosphoglucomutase-like phosphatase (HAD superfamily)